MGASLCTLRESCFAKLPEDGDNIDGEFPKPKKPVKGNAKQQTLEQWMISPRYPVNNQENKQTAKVLPVSYERVYSTPRESFSTDRSKSIGDWSTASTPRRSVSGKRVSFKLPEDEDIHIFYSYDEAEECELMGVVV